MNIFFMILFSWYFSRIYRSKYNIFGMIRDDWYTNIYDSELALKLENVNKYFEISKSGVTDVSFEVKKNEVFGLVGNNGCGKSTIINMIAGIQRP